MAITMIWSAARVFLTLLMKYVPRWRFTCLLAGTTPVRSTLQPEMMPFPLSPLSRSSQCVSWMKLPSAYSAIVLTYARVSVHLISRVSVASLFSLEDLGSLENM